MSKKRILIISVALVLVATIVFGLTMMQSKAKYEVVFHSDTGEVLAIETVKRNTTAIPPKSPEMTYGNIFQKWDTDLTNVKRNLDVYPETVTFTDKANVFALSGGYGIKDDTVFIPFVLRGDVCLSGFDVAIKYDKDILQLESVYDVDGAVIYNNETEGTVYLNYTSLENTVADVDICSFKFRIKKETEKTDIKIKIESICANKDDEVLYTPKSNLINSSVYILS